MLCAAFSLVAQGSTIAELNPDSTSVAIIDSCAFEDSLFPQQALEESEVEIIKKQEDRRKSWFFYIILFQLLLLALVKTFFSKNIETAFKSFSNLNLAAYQYREERGEGSLFKILLNINFILSLGLLSINAMDYYNYEPLLNHFALFCLIVLFISLLYLLKYLQYLLTALVFPVEQIAQFFQFVFFGIMRMLGVVFIPLNLLLYYSSQDIPTVLFFSVLTIFILFFLFLIMRGINISQRQIIENKVHFFLYICTLEIVPVLLLVKFMNAFF